MTRRKDLSDLSAHFCMSPGCRERAVVVKYGRDRWGRIQTKTLCDSCAANTNSGHFQGVVSKARERRAA